MCNSLRFYVSLSLNHILHFLLGSGNQSRQQQQLLPPPPLMTAPSRSSIIGRNCSNGGNSRSSSSGSNMSPSPPPPCPAPNNMHLWASLAAASSFGNLAAFNLPRNYAEAAVPPPAKSMRIASGTSWIQSYAIVRNARSEKHETNILLSAPAQQVVSSLPPFKSFGGKSKAP